MTQKMSLMLNGDFSSAAVKVNIKSDKKLDGQHRGSWFQRHAEQRGINKGYEAMAFPEFARSHFPKNTNPKMVNRNRRMLGIFIPFKIYNGFDHDYGGMFWGSKQSSISFLSLSVEMKYLTNSSGGDSDELIRAEDNVKERKLGEKESRSCRFLCSRFR
ncbi:hypothetical protein YC2023_062501 [Brassica napus]